jgi:hypothetical protein
MTAKPVAPGLENTRLRLQQGKLCVSLRLRIRNTTRNIQKIVEMISLRDLTTPVNSTVDCTLCTEYSRNLHIRLDKILALSTTPPYVQYIYKT